MMYKIQVVIWFVFLIFCCFVIYKSYLDFKELNTALSKRNDLLKVKKAILDLIDKKELLSTATFRGFFSEMDRISQVQGNVGDVLAVKSLMLFDEIIIYRRGYDSDRDLVWKHFKIIN